jgi:hypothetical protein
VSGTRLPISLFIESVSSWTRVVFDEMCVESMSTFRPPQSIESVCAILKST